MQIDFHHTVTYVVSRLAGFSVEESEIISSSAQYVDDAVNSGPIKFRNRAMYSRISSSHRMLDYRNFEELSNHNVWIPFHFLPGNGGKISGENDYESFVEKIVCTPGSYVAEEMIRSCIYENKRAYSLHRLGITLHVLADTYAHQGFAGINHKVNDVVELVREDEVEPVFREKVKDFFGDIFDAIKSRFVSDVLPLGHGGALSCPDLPFLKWRYKNGKGVEIKRDNTEVFLMAVLKMYETLVRYKKNDPDYNLLPEEMIKESDYNRIKSNFISFIDDEGEERHKKWVSSIENGDFSFCGKGEETICYIAKGYNSWKYKALDTKKEIETGNELFKFSQVFLNSDWKLFHDALQIHRVEIIRNILPKYGICVA